jgi:hypothetical protein
MRRTAVSLLAATALAVAFAPSVSSSSGHVVKAPAMAPAAAHQGECPFASSGDL